MITKRVTKSSEGQKMYVTVVAFFILSLYLEGGGEVSIMIENIGVLHLTVQ
jgi:hypothetical protein